MVTTEPEAPAVVTPPWGSDPPLVPSHQAWGTAEGQVLPPGDVTGIKEFRRLPDPTAGVLLGEQGTGAGKDLVTCPECGAMAQVSPSKREADDFCTSCDFPLFWARSTVILPSGEATGASLRRLPGTVGRAATASIPCPHCGELNSPAAQLCIRCSLAMIVVAPPPPKPPPAPVIVPLPPLPEPEPPNNQWIWWVVIAVLTLVIAGIAIWAALR